MIDKEKTIKELKEALDSLDITNKYRLNLIKAIEYLQEEPVILTEAILDKNGFRLNPRPRYKDPYWSKLFTTSDGREYSFNIYTEQIIEHLMKVEPLAALDGHGHPTCYLPHPKTVQQLQDSLKLFEINDIISV